MGVWQGFRDATRQDLRDAARALRSARGTTLAILLTFGLAIGANTAVFSVVYGVLLRPLPYRDSDRLVQIWSRNTRTPEAPVSASEFRDALGQTRAFETAALFQLRRANLTAGGDVESVASARTSSALFSVFGVSPLTGRTFLPEENEAGTATVAVLGYGVWCRRFGADPGVIGRAIRLDGRAVTVVGLMPQGFDFPRGSELWLPLSLDANERTNRLARSFQMVARLKQGVTLRQARTELDTVSARLAASFPFSEYGWSFGVNPLLDELVGDIRRPLLLLLAATVFVLMIACANTATLLLARASGRQGELSVRVALGATRVRIVRQLLSESISLSLLSSSVGLLLAWWVVRILRAESPAGLIRLQDVRIDASVLAFSLLTSIFSGVLFGLAPAVRFSRLHLTGSLSTSVATGVGAAAAGRRARSLIVASEVALSLTLLIGAGLLIKSLWRLTRVDLGFRTEDVLAIPLPRPFIGGAPGLVSDQAFYRRAVREVKSLPYIESAAVVSDEILRGRWRVADFDIPERPRRATGEQYSAQFEAVSPDFFRVLGVHLVKGRVFTDEDGAQRPSVVTINEAAARRFWPAEDPIGKRIAELPRIEGQAEVVGVVSDTREVGLALEPQPKIYACYLQAPISPMTLLVRRRGSPVGLAESVRHRIWQVDPNQPVPSTRTLGDEISSSLAQPRFRALLSGAYALLALALSLTGVYGVTSYSAARRTHEIGIRCALGASPGDVSMLVVRDGLRPAFAGVVVGITGALALARFLSGLLYGVGPTDMATFVAVPLLFVAAAALASYFPARRATRVNPVAALRYE